jgi:hypothetical protein
MGQAGPTTEGLKFSNQDILLVEAISQRAQASDPRQCRVYGEVALAAKEKRRPESAEDNVDNIIIEIFNIIQEIRANVFKVECDGIKHELEIIFTDKALTFSLTKDDRKLWEFLKKKPKSLDLSLTQTGYTYASVKRESEYNIGGYRGIQLYLIEFRKLLKIVYKNWTAAQTKKK